MRIKTHIVIFMYLYTGSIVAFDAYVYRGLLSQYDTGIMTNNATILCVMRSISV